MNFFSNIYFSLKDIQHLLSGARLFTKTVLIKYKLLI